MPSSLPMAPAAAPVTGRRGLRAALALPLAAVLSLPLITAAMTPPAPAHPAAGALLRAAREGDLPAVKQARPRGRPSSRATPTAARRCCWPRMATTCR